MTQDVRPDSATPATRVVIDWTLCSTPAAFYDAVLPQTGAPAWHGRNLDALNDAWIAGSICTGGPPFDFEFRGTPPSGSFARDVLSIARQSVRRHGGRVAIAA